jgi:hypothetical protein
MNWRRDLLRLWLSLSLCWIAGVGLYAWKQEPGISSSQFGFEIASSPEKQNEKEVVGSLNVDSPASSPRAIPASLRGEPDHGAAGGGRADQA